MYPTREYNLPDVIIFDSENNDFHIWVPEKPYIVLGSANNPEDSLYIKNVMEDNIPVYKRPSGGQAVLLTPNNIIISILFNNIGMTSPKIIFNSVNLNIINLLENLGIQNLFLKGISDITINDKKILGSSIYRKRSKLLYHAVLNVAEPTASFERYLKHPEKEPDYRKGRTHKDFVTSIVENGYTIPIEEIMETIKKIPFSVFDLNYS